ncbi:MAG: hypothetical protein KDJ39_09515 [Gammaproteobacteria bacterium]|nr:hypothetical protein [Gammaproteobacteria bacterium]MCP5299805.1 hypothetical protein [Chromatiaceae bacterium]
MPYVLLIFLMLLGSPYAAAQDPVGVATFTVRSQPAAALVDTVRPLLGGGGGASAFHDKLIVRGSAQQIAAVRELLAQIDRPARRLLIEVRQSGRMGMSATDIGYGAASDEVRIGRAPRRPGAQAYYQEFQTRGRDDGTQRVQALDGRAALIRAGQSVPVYRAHQQVIGNQLIQGFDVSYRDALTGFYALPRVHGDQVTVEIYQQHERQAPGGAFDVEHASTVLRGRLGDWLSLGAVGGSDNDKRDAIGRHVQTQRSNDRQIDLRVMAVD